MNAEFKNHFKIIRNPGHYWAVTSVLGGIALILLFVFLFCFAKGDQEHDWKSMFMIGSMVVAFLAGAVFALVQGIEAQKRTDIIHGGMATYGKVMRLWDKKAKIETSNGGEANYKFYVLFSYTGTDGFPHTCRETLSMAHYYAIEKMGQNLPIYVLGPRAVVALNEVNRFIEMNSRTNIF